MFIGLLIAMAALLITVLMVHFSVDHRARSTVRDANETLNVALAKRALEADIASVTTDLLFLGGLLESLSFDTRYTQARRDYLAQVFATFAREKRLYDQVRFLDAAGKERVRINLTAAGAEIVAPGRLQDKSARYYVPHSLRLGRGQVYLSRFDLNVEGGEIERPFKPMLRFATPVFDDRDRLEGLVVINYLGARLLDRFREATANIGDHVQLLNGDGFWLSSPRPDEAWAFMFGREQTFAQRFPAAWRQMAGTSEGQIRTNNGLFTFATVRPAAEAAGDLDPGSIATADAEVWKVVSHLRLDAASLGLGRFIGTHAPLYMGLSAVLAVLSFLLANAIVHRRAAESHRAYETRFRRTLEDIGLAALMIDVHGRLTFCNHYLLELTGWPREQVLGKRWVEHFVPPEQRTAIEQVIARLRETGAYPGEFEGELCTVDGERRLIAWNNALARDAQGRVIGLTAIGEDITERRAAEEQVRRLSQAVEQSPAIVLITDREGRIEYVNRKFREVTGYTLDEVHGRNPRILKSGETPDREYGRLWEALREGGEWRGEFHNRRKDGSLYWESALVSALRDADGEITHFLALKEDITERKRLQSEVEQRNLELARTQALAAMGQMSTMLAHDLRNPLSSVKMSVQILGKQAQGQETQELAAIGQEQVRYMEDIISDMLSYSRPGKLKPTWLSADKLLDGVISTVRRRIVEYGVEVETRGEPGLPTFPGDASKLRQLLSNLLVNALRAAAVNPEGERRVWVETSLVLVSAGRRIQFKVCDNGDGVDPDTCDRLFEPFYTTHAKGTGLGLAIVRQIAELHGADVSLSPGENGGACAVLVLPLTPVGDVAKPAVDDGMRERAGR